MTKPLSMSAFRALQWKEVYHYEGQNVSFKVFGCDLEGLVIVHDAKPRKKVTYRACGKSTDSPSQAVKIYNQGIRQRANPANL